MEDDLERLRELAEHCHTMAIALAKGDARESLQRMAEELERHVSEVERERWGLRTANDTGPAIVSTPA